MPKVAFLSGGSDETTLEGISRAFSRVFTSSGVIGDGDFDPSENGTPNNTVLVAPGSILIGFEAPLDDQEDRYYFGFLEAATNVTVTANSSGSDRIDALVAYVNTAGGAADDNDGALVLDMVEGTPAATPVAPTKAAIATALGAGVPFIVLAHVAADNGFSSIVNADITDLRPFADSHARIIEDGLADYVATGLVWSQSSGLIGQMTTGRAYVGGRLINKSYLTHTFSASKDTYVDLPAASFPDNQDDLTYTEVANGATAPALAAGSIRLAKVVTNGSAITSSVTSGYGTSSNVEIRPTASLPTISVLRDNDGTRAAHPTSVILTGWGAATATGSAIFISETVTFGVTFTDTYPIVICNATGGRAASPTPATDFTENVFGNASLATTTSFKATVMRGDSTNLQASGYAYTWIAIGRLA